MLNKIYIKIMLLLVGAALVTGCEKSGLQPYTGGNTVGFWVHSINHSFYGEGVETLPKDTIVLDLAITGDVVDYDRHVDGTFILDAAGTEEKDLKNTAVEGKDYKILGGVVKANEEYGEFMVEVYNTDELKEKELKLNLAIKENEDFSVGLGENRSITITWSQKIMQPTTWRAMRFFFCSTYSTQVYRHPWHGADTGRHQKVLPDSGEIKGRRIGTGLLHVPDRSVDAAFGQRNLQPCNLSEFLSGECI